MQYFGSQSQVPYERKILTLRSVLGSVYLAQEKVIRPDDKAILHQNKCSKQ